MKKLFSVLLSVIMIMAAMSVNAFAAGEGKITVRDATKGVNYYAYKLLDLDYRENGTGSADDSYVYEIDLGSKWHPFISTARDNANNSLFLIVDTLGHISPGVLSDANAAEFALKAKNFAKEHNIAAEASREADSTTVVFDGLDLGYYLVFSDADTAALSMLGNTDTEAVIKDKNYIPMISKYDKEKRVWEKANDGFIGEVLEYRIEIIAEEAPDGYTVRDTLDNGHLILDEDSIKVALYRDTNDDGTADWLMDLSVEDGGSYVSDSDGEGEYYGMVTNAAGFEIIFNDAALDILKTNDIITIEYKATIAPGTGTGYSATGGHYNTATLMFGNGKTASDTTKTYTYTLPVYKFALEDGTGNKLPLADAKFIIKNTTELDFTEDYLVVINEDSDEPVENFPEDVDGEYYLSWTDNTSEATVFTSGADGKILIDGIDAGTYHIIEVDPPAGYSKLQGDVVATILDLKTSNTGLVNYGTDLQDGSDLLYVMVENKKGIALPETGGIGTTIFYVAGGVLVLGAAVVLLTKKKTEENN